MRIPVGVVLTALLVGATTAHGEVTARSAAGFVSEHLLDLPVPAGRVYQALTDEVALWWDAEHSWSGNSAGFSFDARAGGCFCERLSGGGSVEHMRVVFAAPGRRLVLKGGLGPLLDMSVVGTMVYQLDDLPNGHTRLRYRYTVGGYSPDGLEMLADAVDQVQLGQLRRLSAFLEGAQSLE